ncbi:alpha/beta hydrolase [Barrientosiimonas marina]|uniref:Alpha/beta hydrolase n=1 Tax=Lentibacillus kimchii TaxID=1542911 RepID=A0ABW2UWY1_9BACI
MNYIKYLESEDGTKLYTKVNDVAVPKANLIISHGIAEHLDRYDQVADFFQTNHINVIRYDQRGHGRSGGKSTYYSRVDEITEDLDAIVTYTRANYSGKIFLLGHSMGGYTVSLYGTKYPNKIDGYITSGAATRMNNSPFGEIDTSLSDDYYVENALADGVCSDQEVAEKYEYDDLVSKKIAMGLIYRLAEGIEFLKQNPESFVDPILIMHGRHDGLVSTEDSFQFYREIASKDKSLRIYDGLEHEILNESSYNHTIFNDMLNWINTYLE